MSNHRTDGIHVIRPKSFPHHWVKPPGGCLAVTRHNGQPTNIMCTEFTIELAGPVLPFISWCITALVMEGGAVYTGGGRHFNWTVRVSVRDAVAFPKAAGATSVPLL